MRLLFVWPAAEWSTFDVAAGLRPALERAGHAVRDYRLHNRIKFAANAFAADGKDELAGNGQLLARLASEAVLAEAIYHQAELVLFVSGLSLHPVAPLMCRMAGIPTAIVHTESPYEDEDQGDLSEHVDVTFTNDRGSAERHGWHYLPHAYDPAVHRPLAAPYLDPALFEAAGIDIDRGVDVLICGTGWPERVDLLSGVDWSGMSLRILGLWGEVGEGHVLQPHYREALVRNKELVQLYQRARICVNAHRGSEVAVSLNPRARELAACGAFQVSDHREEVRDVFPGGLPEFGSSSDLERLLRHYLAHDGERVAEQQEQFRAVAARPNTFDDRAAQLTGVLEAHLDARRRQPAGATTH